MCKASTSINSMNKRESTKISKGINLSSFGMVYQTLVTFLSAIIIARLLGPSDYGILSIVRNIALLLVVFSMAGFDIALIKRFGEAGETEKRKTLGSILLAVLVVIFIFSLFPIIVSQIGISQYLEDNVYDIEDFSSFFNVMLFIVPALALMQVMNGALKGQIHFTPAILSSSFVLPSLRFILSLTAISIGFGLKGVLWMNVLAAILSMLFVAYYAKNYFIPSIKDCLPPKWISIKQISRYSLTMSLSVVVITVTKGFDLLALGKYVEVDEVGRYAILTMALAFIPIFSLSLGNSIGGIVAKYWKENNIQYAANLVKKYNNWILFLTAPLFVIACFYGHVFITLFGDDYYIQQSVVVTLASAQLVFALYGNSGWFYSMTGKQSLEFYILCFGLLVTIVLNLILIPLYGVFGAAISTLIAAVIINAVRGGVLKYYFHISLVSFRVIKPILLSLVMMLLVKLTTNWLFNLSYLIEAIVATLIFTILYSLSVWAFLLEIDEKNELKNRYLKMKPFTK